MMCVLQWQRAMLAELAAVEPDIPRACWLAVSLLDTYMRVEICEALLY
jgi:hypothetical protein